MAFERWLVDGYDLTDGLVRDVEYRAGLTATPAVVGANATVPNRIGELWRPKHHGPGKFTLALWLAPAGGRWQDVEAAWEDLLRAVARPHRLLTFERHTAAGQVRRCQGEVLSALTPTPLGQDGMRISLEVNVPSGYWESADVAFEATAPGVPLPQDLDLEPFADATAPMEQLAYRITGPITAPTVTDTTDGTGDSFTYTGQIPAGQALTVDAATWQLTGSGGLVPDPGRLTNTGPAFLRLTPGLPGTAPSVRLTGTNPGPTTQLAVTGRRAYLT
ncbi:hypothetical protein HUT16_27340 [Kitasatospora sp. NA04385]|uniref:hypothetical protein n=1 Tax=Kitasatospora sp. NA04385 TaxID=2742135 RepID=UPI0015924A6A|nr:hypothetical protein [Kitasatospora sp. NA04385]QKW22295.1 hypothetical protein HUT16_27340 [Kitasatospora sp. NA04385]